RRDAGGQRGFRGVLPQPSQRGGAGAAGSGAGVAAADRGAGAVVRARPPRLRRRARPPAARGVVMGSPLVRSGDRSLRDATRVGHKFARQERLRRAGFPVPELVCVPVAVFDAVTRDLPPPPTAPGTPGPATPDGPAAPGPAENGRALHAWAQAAAEQISRAPLPAGLADDLRSAAAALVGRDGLVAVRACVVADAEGAGEDGGTDPFAGLT